MPILPYPTPPPTPLTVERAIPEHTDRATLLALARRYADTSDPMVRTLPRDDAAAIRRRLVMLFCGCVEEAVA